MEIINIIENINPSTMTQLSPVQGKIQSVMNTLASSITLRLNKPDNSYEDVSLETGSSMDFWFDGTAWKRDMHIPADGSTGQVFSKKSNTDYDLQWSDFSNAIGLKEAEAYKGYSAAPAAGPTIVTASLPSYGMIPSVIKSVPGTYRYKTTFCKEEIKLMSQYITGSMTAGSFKHGIIFDGTYIWVTNNDSGNVLKINASTNSVIATIAVGTYPWGLCYDGTYVWVANSGSANISKIDMSTNSVIETVTVLSAPRHICYDGNFIWVTHVDDNYLLKINTSTNAIIATISVGIKTWGLCYDGNNIWVSNTSAGNNVLKIDTSTNTVIATIECGQTPWGICYDENNIWVTNVNSGNISKINPVNNTIVATINVGSFPRGLCFDGTNLWVINQESKNITKINPYTNNVIATINTESDCFTICYDGSFIWIPDSISNIIQKLIANHMQFYPVPETEAGTASTAINLSANTDCINLTNIPVSSDSTIKARKIYRSKEGTKGYVLVGYINDNTTTTFRDIPQDMDYIVNPALPTYYPENFAPVRNTSGDAKKVNGNIVELNSDASRYI